MMINPTKKKKIQAIQEKLLDLYIIEADPANWTSVEQIRDDLLQEVNSGKLKLDQVDRELKKRLASFNLWEKKNANATMAMLCRVNTFFAQVEGNGTPADEEDDEATRKEIARMEKQAKKQLRLVKPRMANSRD
ncbi:MAG TPA: hypothetical protein DCZ63_08430 [Geobacter sp.]|nr:hypothetical protein [Geobacter sp.]